MSVSCTVRTIVFVVASLLLVDAAVVRGGDIWGRAENLRFEYIVRGAHRDGVMDVGGRKMNMGANVRHRLGGRVVWGDWDANGFTLDLSVDRVEYGFPDPKPVHGVPVLKVEPFTAEVVMSRLDGGSLAVKLTKGRDEDAYGVTRQYNVARGILEMMCATVVRKDFTAAAGGGLDTVTVTYPGAIAVEGIDVSPKAEVLSYRPTEYTALPQLSADGVRATELFSLRRGKTTICLATRMLDRQTGLAIAGVNLEAVAKSEITDAGYSDMLELFDKPHEFESYTLYEFKATPETRK